MHKTRSSVRVWCYSLPPSLLRRPSSAACSCSTLNSQLATLNSQLSTRNSRATLALLRNSCSLASSARPRLGLRRYRAFVRPGIFSAPSLSSASACPLPSPLRGSGRAYLHPPTLRGQLVGRRVARCRSPCRSPPAGYSRGNQTQNPVGIIKKVVVIQLAVL